MFEFLFSKRIIITVTIVVLTGMLISIIYQMVFYDSPEKRRNNAINNSEIVEYGDYFIDTICDVENRTFQKYLFCNYERGYYFGNSAQDVDSEIYAFIQKGKTVLKKRRNDATAYFINSRDTLIVVFEVYPSNRVLYKGKIKR